MKLKKLGIGSVGKTALFIYGLLGLLIGAIFSLISLVGVAFAAGQDDPAWMGMLFGVGAIVILPLFYGVLGAIVWMIGAAIYNLSTRWTGGIEVDLE